VALGPAQDFASVAQAKLAQFVEEIGKLFSEHGIDTSVEVMLRLDPSGGLTVANDHPDKDQIEALLERTGFAEDFRALSLYMTRARAFELRSQPEKPSEYVAHGGLGIPHFHLAIQEGRPRIFFTSR